MLSACGGVAMGRSGAGGSVVVTLAQRAAVERMLRRRDLAPRLRERLEMVKAAALGQDRAAIAAWSGRSVGTVGRWLAAFAGGGVEALADAPRGGRPRKAGAAYLDAAERALDSPPGGLGLPFDAWTSARLAAYLAETTGVRVAPGWLRALLARRRWRAGRPKHSVKHLQDPAEVAACEQELAAAEKNRGRRPGALRAAPPG
jgi:transposase